jgi:hypothetical protein
MRALLINFLPLNLTTHASTYTTLLAVGTWTDEILYFKKLELHFFFWTEEVSSKMRLKVR